MNNDNCVQIGGNWSAGHVYNAQCSLLELNGSYTLTTLVNVSRVDFDVLQKSSGAFFTICKYDLKGNYVGVNRYSNLNVGDYSIDLDPNYLYKMSYFNSSYANPKLYKCNTGISSMSNSLAFGSSSFLDTIGVIVPFIIILIAFALGFKFLKKIIKSTSKGKANV